MTSPIAFFAFNRHYHTIETLNSLCNNQEISQTDFYAFIDGPRKTSEIQLIDNVEKIIRSFESKFKSLTINRSEINLSGAINQKRGITKVLPNEPGKPTETHFVYPASLKNNARLVAFRNFLFSKVNEWKF